MENNRPPNGGRFNFQELRSKGNRLPLSSWLVVYWAYSDTNEIRIVWNLSRKVANSVVRNRLKRWCRDFLRHRIVKSDACLVSGLDINFAFRPLSKDFYKDLRRAELDNILSRLEKKIRESLGKSS